MAFSASIEKLIEEFEKLPSIGHKTAVRLAFYILNSQEEVANDFAKAILDARKNFEININRIRVHTTLSLNLLRVIDSFYNGSFRQPYITNPFNV